jgi:lipoprotein-releasing system ATP-binding protein
MITPPAPILRLTDIHRSYNVGTEVETEVLHGISLALQQAEFVALKGPSGSGTLEIAGQPTQWLDDAGLTQLRGATIGFVFQFHHLLPAFTALENVLIPSIIAHGTATLDAEANARELLARVGLKGAEYKRPGELSGGMQQRVAIARALSLRPRLILADEPTGNLDPKTSEVIWDLFLRLQAERHLAFVIATHNHELARKADRGYRLVDGRAVPWP